ncbi:hypothetical protein VTN31DRAFT_7425 [Thermomyces dupontii]|uniref:uncharacterized protein n=1 Tax=Talaromyces thermophilus TaxID=28565 RepID=UPI00374342A6
MTGRWRGPAVGGPTKAYRVPLPTKFKERVDKVELHLISGFWCIPTTEYIGTFFASTPHSQIPLLGYLPRGREVCPSQNMTILSERRYKVEVS